MDAGSPEDLIGHPVSDPGEGVLVEKEALEGFARMTPEDFREPGLVKGRLVGLGREVGPPVGGRCAPVKADPPEFPVIGKDERGMGEDKDKVIVFARDHFRFAASKLPGHAEVEPEPAIPREPETELLAVGLGLQEAAAFEGGGQAGGLGPAENPGPGMELDGMDSLADGEEPLLAVKLDLGKFGHGGDQKDQRKGTMATVPTR